MDAQEKAQQDKARNFIEKDFEAAKKQAENGVYDVIAMQGACNTATLAGIKWYGTPYERRDSALQNRAEIISALKEISALEDRMLKGEWIDIAHLLARQESKLRAEIRSAQATKSKCRDSEALTAAYMVNSCKDAQIALCRIEGLINEAKSRAARAHRESVRYVQQNLHPEIRSRFVMWPSGRLDGRLLRREGWHAIKPETCRVFDWKSGKFKQGLVKA